MITQEEFDRLSTGEGTTPEDWTKIFNVAFIHKDAKLGIRCHVMGSCEFRGGLFRGGEFHGGVFHGGVFYGGIFHDGVFHGGVFHDGIFHDGVFHDGVFHGGSFHNGIFRGGEFQGGIFYTGTFRGGSFYSGSFYGGLFHNGVFHSGEYWDGEFNGGVFHDSPMLIRTLLPWICVGNNTMVSVGCEVHTPQYWIDNIDRIADGHGVSEENRQKVLMIVKFISEFHKEVIR